MVGDLRQVTGLLVCREFDQLYAAVWEDHRVLSPGYVAVRVLVVTVDVTVVLVVDCIREVEWHPLLFLFCGGKGKEIS